MGNHKKRLRLVLVLVLICALLLSGLCLIRPALAEDETAAAADPAIVLETTESGSTEESTSTTGMTEAVPADVENGTLVDSCPETTQDSAASVKETSTTAEATAVDSATAVTTVTDGLTETGPAATESATVGSIEVSVALSTSVPEETTESTESAENAETTTTETSTASTEEAAVTTENIQEAASLAATEETATTEPAETMESTETAAVSSTKEQVEAESPTESAAEGSVTTEGAEEAAESVALETTGAETLALTVEEAVEEPVPLSAGAGDYTVRLAGSYPLGESLSVSLVDGGSYARSGYSVTFVQGLSCSLSCAPLPEETMTLTYPALPEGTTRVLLVSGDAVIGENSGAVSSSFTCPYTPSVLLVGLAPVEEPSFSTLTCTGDFGTASVTFSSSSETPSFTVEEVYDEAYEARAATALGVSSVSGRFFSFSAAGTSEIREITLTLAEPLSGTPSLLEVSCDPAVSYAGATASGFTLSIDHLGVFGLVLPKEDDPSVVSLTASYGVYDSEVFTTLLTEDVSLPFTAASSPVEGYAVSSLEIVRGDLILKLSGLSCLSDQVEAGDTLRVVLLPECTVRYGTLDDNGSFVPFDRSFSGTGNAVQDISGCRYVKTIDEDGNEVLPVVDATTTGTLSLIYRPYRFTTGGTGVRERIWPSADLGEVTGAFREAASDTVTLSVTGSEQDQELTPRSFVILLMDLTAEGEELQNEKEGMLSFVDSLPSDTLYELVCFGSLASRITTSPVDAATVKSIVSAESHIAGSSNWEDAFLVANEVPVPADRNTALVLAAVKRPVVYTSGAGDKDTSCFSLSCPVFGTGEAAEGNVSSCVSAAADAASEARSLNKSVLVLDLGAGSFAAPIPQDSSGAFVSRPGTTGFADVVFTDPLPEGVQLDSDTPFTYTLTRDGMSVGGSVQGEQVWFGDLCIGAASYDASQNAVVWPLGSDFQVPAGWSVSMSYAVRAVPVRRRARAVTVSASSSLSTLSYTRSLEDSEGVELIGSAILRTAALKGPALSSFAGSLQGEVFFDIYSRAPEPEGNVTAHLVREGLTSGSAESLSSVSLPADGSAVDLEQSVSVGTITLSSTEKTDGAYTGTADGNTYLYRLAEDAIPGFSVEDFEVRSTSLSPVVIVSGSTVLAEGYLEPVNAVGSDSNTVDYYRIGNGLYRLNTSGVITLTNEEKEMPEVTLQSIIDPSAGVTLSQTWFTCTMTVTDPAERTLQIYSKKEPLTVSVNGAAVTKTGDFYAVPLQGGSAEVTLGFNGSIEKKDKNGVVVSTEGTLVYLQGIGPDSVITVRQDSGERLDGAGITYEVTSDQEVKVSDLDYGDTKAVQFKNRGITNLKFYKSNERMTPDSFSISKLLDGAVFTLEVKTNGSFEPVQEDFRVPKDGAVLTGLLCGSTYKLTEKQAPDGYEKQKPTTFTVTGDGEAEVALACTQYAGALSHGLYILDQEKGSLPATGGSGTLPFKACGSIALAAAALFLLFRWHKSGRR